MVFLFVTDHVPVSDNKDMRLQIFKLKESDRENKELVDITKNGNLNEMTCKTVLFISF